MPKLTPLELQEYWQPRLLAEVFFAGGEVAEEIGRAATSEEYAHDCYLRVNEYLHVALQMYQQTLPDIEYDFTYLTRSYMRCVMLLEERIEAFPLFGFRLEDYDALFAEKLDLLLNIREHEHVQWSGKFRPALTGQGVYPRPVQNPLPIWLGVGGTPQSFVRAGQLGLPLMVAIIGGEPRRFRPLIDLYRETGRQHGYSPEQLKVGVHMLGYVADTTQEAAETFFPGYAKAMTDVGKERGWPAMTRASFDAQRGRTGPC